jgi:hypothetical protein
MGCPHPSKWLKILDPLCTLEKKQMAFQKNGLVRKAPANSQSGIYISMAVAVCKRAKIPYGENFVKICAGSPQTVGRNRLTAEAPDGFLCAG